jgi:hypothetical protein
MDEGDDYQDWLELYVYAAARSIDVGERNPSGHTARAYVVWIQLM